MIKALTDRNKTHRKPLNESSAYTVTTHLNEEDCLQLMNEAKRLNVSKARVLRDALRKYYKGT